MLCKAARGSAVTTPGIQRTKHSCRIRVNMALFVTPLTEAYESGAIKIQLVFEQQWPREDIHGH